MLRSTPQRLQSGKFFKLWEKKGKRKRSVAMRATDNTPLYDKGSVEWIPRPIRLPYETIDEARDWMMRQTVDGNVEEFNTMREMMRTWGQHPKRPVLGDVEPRFPEGIVKMNHSAPRRFQYRWHKANSPNNWMWLPKEESAQHWGSSAEYPENWKAMRDAMRSAQRRPAAAEATTTPSP